MTDIQKLKELSVDDLLQELRAREAKAGKTTPAVPLEPSGNLREFDDITVGKILKEKQKVIYGVDDRVDLYQLPGGPNLDDADTVVALFVSSKVIDNGNGTSTLQTQNFGAARNLCAGERFRDQPIGAFCSGFLVAPDIIATAGHCVNATNVTNIRFVFGFRMRPVRFETDVDAGVVWTNGKAYFFKGSEYIRYDIATDKVDPGYPLPIAGNWPGLWADNIDAGVVWPNGKAYFFRGSEYERYDVATDRVDPGYPLPIAGNWPGFPAHFATGIDAGVVWTNGKAYFFKGSEYIRYDIATDKVDPGYPLPIAGNWPGLWADNINAGVVWPNGKAYFFRGSEYMRYDVATDRVDPGYPQPIAGNWPGFNAVAETIINNAEIYSGVAVIGRQEVGNGPDWSLVRIDRSVTNHRVARIRRTGRIGDTQAVHVIGHPVGLPTKFAGGAAVRSNQPNAFFVANLDTYGGNSGSPVFNSNTHEVEGILVRGETDFATQGTCQISLVCPTTGCRGEDCTRTTEFAHLV